MAKSTIKQIRPRIPVDQDVYTLALERTANVLTEFDAAVVSFSGGKDSTAVLNVVLEVIHSDRRFDRHLPLRVAFSDEEAIPVETEDYVRRMAARGDITLEWYCLPVQHRNACSRRSPFWWPWAPEAEELWCRPLPPEAITELPGFNLWPADDRISWPLVNGLLCPPERGNHAMLMGIRADESLTRARMVSRKPHDNYIVPWTKNTAGNVWKVYPIFDWSTEDVWTATGRRGWDYNTAYDRLEQAGVSRSQQRCSPAFGEEPLQKLHTYAACFPEVWDKMVDRVPGVGAAVRYARTELYSYGGHPPKPDGVPWPDYIRSYVDRWGPDQRPGVAARVNAVLTRHYRKTAHPILPHAPHPLSGLNWRFLFTIASRGDFKERKQESFNVSEFDDQRRPHPKYWHAYAAELEELLTSGRFAECGYPRPHPIFSIPPYALEDTG